MRGSNSTADMRARKKVNSRCLSNKTLHLNTQGAAKRVLEEPPVIDTSITNENTLPGNTSTPNANSVHHPSVELQVPHPLHTPIILHPPPQPGTDHPLPTTEPITPAGARLPGVPSPLTHTLGLHALPLLSACGGVGTRSSNISCASTHSDAVDIGEDEDLPTPQNDFEASKTKVTAGERAIWYLNLLVDDIQDVARCPACSKGERAFVQQVLDLGRYSSAVDGVVRVHPLISHGALVWVTPNKWFETFLDVCCVNCVNVYHVYTQHTLCHIVHRPTTCVIVNWTCAYVTTGVPTYRCSIYISAI
jgi:hypothetical protein